jgi:hypothetical protein
LVSKLNLHPFVLPAKTEKQKRNRNKSFETLKSRAETRKREVIIKTYSELERTRSHCNLEEQKNRGFLVADKVSCSSPTTQLELITGSCFVAVARLSLGRQ